MGPSRIVPPVGGCAGGMMDPLLPSAGWTGDGAALGYSVAIAVDRIGELLRPGGAREHLRGDGENAESSRKFEHDVEALQLRGDRSGNWAYPELEITWTTGGEGCAKDPPVAEVVRVGARLPGEPAAYPMRLTLALTREGTCYGSGHPELIAVSPDGKYLGAIAHGFAGEWANDYPMAILPVAAVAEAAFNEAGLAHHRKGDYPRAAELFRKATAADPTSKTAAYDLACALARLGDARAEGALRDAIDLGGEDARTRARKDGDFAAVSTAPWFTALVKDRP